MEISITGALVSIVTTLAGSSLLTAFVSNYFLRKKFEAEAESIITKNYRDLIVELREEINSYREQLKIFDEEKTKIELGYLKKFNTLMENVISLTEKVGQLENENCKQKTKIEQLEKNNQNLTEKIRTITDGKLD